MNKEKLSEVFNELLKEWYQDGQTIINDRSIDWEADEKYLDERKKELEDKFAAALEEPTKIFQLVEIEVYSENGNYEEIRDIGYYLDEKEADKVFDKEVEKIENYPSHQIYMYEIEIK